MISPKATTAPALPRWKYGVFVVTLLAVTSCSTVRLMPPSELQAMARARDTSRTGNPLEPGRWYLFRGYTDSHGGNQSVSGRVRAVPGDSLEFESDDSSSPYLTPVSRRSVVPSDSVSELRAAGLGPRSKLLVSAAPEGCIIRGAPRSLL